jgi:hypothetical protein
MAKGDILHTATTVSNGTSTVPGLAFGATPISGNLILCFAYVHDGGSTLTLPSGFTSIVQSSPDWPKLAVYAKVAGGSESNDYGLTLGAATETMIRGFNIEGVFSDLSGVSGVQRVVAFGSSIKIIAADQSVAANTLVFSAIAVQNDRSTTMAFNNSFANTLHNNDAGAGSLSTARRLYASADTTVTTTASWTTNSDGNSALLMIALGGGGGSTQPPRTMNQFRIRRAA